MKKITILCVFVLLLTSISAGVAESDAYYIGTLKNGTYENELFGIGCSFPDWAFQEINYDQVKAGLEKEASAVTMGQSPSGFNFLLFGLMDSRVKECPETSEAVLQYLTKELLSMFEELGFKFKSPENGTTKLAGSEEICGFCKGTYNSGTASAYVKSVITKKDNYFMIILCMTLNSNKTDDILSHLYSLEK